MKWLSFRSKIIGTLVIGITLYSVTAFTVYSIVLKNKLVTTAEENIEHINLLRDQYYFTIRQHDGSIIRSLLKNMEVDNHVMGTFLMDSSRKVIYQTDYSRMLGDTAGFSRLYSQEKDITIKTHSTGSASYNRVFIRMQNTPSCYPCHNPATQTLGMIVLDLSNSGTQKIVTYTWKFSFIYTILLLIGIFGLVAYLHYRFIRSSLGHFRSTITMINQGNLEVRLTIPEVNELGNLGKNFNEMLETLERTQKELQAYHQQELQTSQKLATIGEMSARIAHEIRNPITGIARAMEIIISDMKEDRNKPILEEIQRQANRVEQAISNLLKYSRSQDVRLHTGDINEVIKSMVFFLRHQAYEKPVTFLMDLQEDIPALPFDHELLENVFMNLSFNAVKSVTENGRILYTTRYDAVPKEVIIAIQDNGTGVPPEAMDEIFKPFFTTHTKGTGLGLAISKDIIDKHHGRIWFENNEEAGCTFYIALPVQNGKRLPG